MYVPKYVQELMGRATYAQEYGDPGYTLEIRKSSPYAYASSLAAEIKRLENWARRRMPEDGVPMITIDKIPEKTVLSQQHAVVTIYDPLMQSLEPYIPQGNE